MCIEITLPHTPCLSSPSQPIPLLLRHQASNRSRDFTLTDVFLLDQKWETAIAEHVAFSRHYTRVAADDESNDEDVVPLGSMAESLQVSGGSGSRVLQVSVRSSSRVLQVSGGGGGQAPGYCRSV